MRRVILLAIAMLALLFSSSAYRPDSSFDVGAAPGPVPEQITAVPLFRLYLLHSESYLKNPNDPLVYQGSPGFHFYTTDSSEKDGLLKYGGYADEGITGWVLRRQAPGTVALYRLSKSIATVGGRAWGTKHFYTVSKTEADKAVSAFGFKLEGIQCYVAPPDKPMSGMVPLYRLYRPPTPGPSNAFYDTGDYDHFYTTSADEKYKATQTLQYSDEGIACYIWPQATTLDDGKIAKVGVGKPPPDFDTDLLNRGCTRSGVDAYRCPTQGGYEACESYRRKGKFKTCFFSASASEQDAQKAMEDDLFKVGCTRFLDRPDEFRCKTPKALEACYIYLKKGQAKKCMQSWK